MIRLPALACALLALAQPAMSQPVRAAPAAWPLEPAHTLLAFRSYRLGLFPADGRFESFDGRFVYDPASHDCSVDLTAAVASLRMDDAAVRQSVLSSELLDADRYPTLAYHGRCEGERIVGSLTLHGRTRPFALALNRNGASVIAQGTLQRAGWGITGLPVLAGQSVRIEVRTTLPN